jgi:hypothetical protein
MRHLITDPQQLVAELATRRDRSELLAFSALPDAPVRPVVERRPGLLRRAVAGVRLPVRAPTRPGVRRPAIAGDAATCG